MDLQNLLPQQSQPIQRITAGQLPAELAELSELNLSNLSSSSLVLKSGSNCIGKLGDSYCSHVGDEAE
uniref:Uncharacterized protein n=1 Tax=Cyanothece sp. (strain PCC 7425 / ATCC 29141) TaxID=395961 RepID=B8HTY1_CYAP4